MKIIFYRHPRLLSNLFTLDIDFFNQNYANVSHPRLDTFRVKSRYWRGRKDVTRIERCKVESLWANTVKTFLYYLLPINLHNDYI